MAGILIVPALNESNESNWPERWSTEALLAKRAEIGPIAFASQYMMAPEDLSNNPLRPDWLHYVDVRELRSLVFYMGVDPSPSGRRGTDFTALSVLGVTPSRSITCLFEAQKYQLEPHEQVELIKRKAELYRPASIVIEAYSAQQLFTRYFFQGSGLPIREARATRIPKSIRIISMATYFNNGTVLCKGKRDAATGELIADDAIAPFVEEWTRWNETVDRDDILDSVDKALEAAGISGTIPVSVVSVADKSDASADPLRPSSAQGGLDPSNSPPGLLRSRTRRQGYRPLHGSISTVRQRSRRVGGFGREETKEEREL